MNLSLSIYPAAKSLLPCSSRRFPELWYSWRHQMLDLSSKGFREIAPYLRGFGDTDVPPCTTSYTVFHIVANLVGLLDSLGLDRVFLVGYDWGAVMAWCVFLLRNDRIKSLVNMSVVFSPRIRRGRLWNLCAP